MVESLPILDPIQNKLTTATSALGKSFPLRFGNDLWKVECVQPHLDWQPELHVPLQILGESGIIEFAMTPGGQLFERFAEFQEIETLSEPFALAISAALSRELLDSIQTALDTPVELPHSPSTTLPPLSLQLQVLDHTGNRECLAVLRMGEKTAERVIAVSSLWTSKPNSNTQNSRIALHLGIALLELSVAELAGIQLGDALILGDADAWPFPFWVGTGCTPRCIGVRPDLCLPPPFTMESEHQDPPDASPSQLPLNDLKLPVFLVVDHREMSLAELASLHPGSTLEMPPTDQLTVELHVNGQSLASGRLVRIADKICVQITETQARPIA